VHETCSVIKVFICFALRIFSSRLSLVRTCVKLRKLFIFLRLKFCGLFTNKCFKFRFLFVLCVLLKNIIFLNSFLLTIILESHSRGIAHFSNSFVLMTSKAADFLVVRSVCASNVAKVCAPSGTPEH